MPIITDPNFRITDLAQIFHTSLEMLAIFPHNRLINNEQ